MIKVLSISDQVDPRVYSKNLKERYGDVEFVISCGDLSYMYLEYIITILNSPLYFVHGNHDPEFELNAGEPRQYPLGAQNLHGRHLRNQGILLAGVEGSIRYNRRTPYQYTQGKMWNHVFKLVPGLFYNRFIHGRYLDIFVTHAPSAGVHEGSDWAHQGIKAFRWLIDTFQPAYHFHGHIHYYHPDDERESWVGKTKVINTYRSQVTEINQKDLAD
ncbi:MAG: metallophosphoesterase [Anaerolineales bacterium]|nr:metallophosphoesterase [Anaerolineales bacterium]